MKITYDQTVDAMRIDFQRGNYEVSEEVGEGIIILLTLKILLY